jgi:hypothetical protein
MPDRGTIPERLLRGFRVVPFGHFLEIIRHHKSGLNVAAKIKEAHTFIFPG